jgi:hypothetical protein
MIFDAWLTTLAQRKKRLQTQNPALKQHFVAQIGTNISDNPYTNNAFPLPIECSYAANILSVRSTSCIVHIVVSITAKAKPACAFLQCELGRWRLLRNLLSPGAKLTASGRCEEMM